MAFAYLRGTHPSRDVSFAGLVYSFLHYFIVVLQCNEDIMQIFVNGKEVKFTPHEETYLSDVLIKLKPWLENNGFYLESVAVDQVFYHAGNISDLAGKKIEDVKKVEITALSRLEIEFIQYSVIRNYFNALIDAIDKKDSNALKNLASQYDEIQKTLSLNVKFAQGKENQLDLMLKNPADGDNPEAIKNAAASIVKLCENGLEELKNGKN